MCRIPMWRGRSAGACAARRCTADSSTSYPRPIPPGTGEDPSTTGIVSVVTSSSYWSSRLIEWAEWLGRTAAMCMAIALPSVPDSC